MKGRLLAASCFAVMGCAVTEYPPAPTADALQQAIDRGQCGGDVDRVDYSENAPNSHAMLSVLCAPQDRGPPNVALQIYPHVDPRVCDDCTTRNGGWLDASVWIEIRRAVDVERLRNTCRHESPARHGFGEWRGHLVTSAGCADDPPSQEWARAISALHLARQKVKPCSQFNPRCFEHPENRDPPWAEPK